MTRTRLRDRPLPQRLLATWFLLAMAAGFVAAQVNLRLHHASADGEPGLAYSDVVAAFHGRPGVSLLTTKISPGGSMAKNLPIATERDAIIDWVRLGATESEFAAAQDVLSRRCVRCHSPGGKMPHAPFGESKEQGAMFTFVKPFTAPSSGMSWGALARSSHAHIFGLAMLFALAGCVFLQTSAPLRAKAVIISIPYVALFVDVGSWWLTKLHASFAIGIIAGGALMGLSFAILIGWPLLEMWGPTAWRVGGRAIGDRGGGGSA